MNKKDGDTRTVLKDFKHGGICYANRATCRANFKTKF